MKLLDIQPLTQLTFEYKKSILFIWTLDSETRPSYTLQGSDVNEKQALETLLKSTVSDCL